MTTEDNKAVVRRFFKAFEANDQAGLAAVLSPDLVAYSHGAPGPQSLEVHLQGIRGWHMAFGDNHFDIDEQIAEGDSVASRMTMRATHSGGAFMGLPATGKQIAVAAVTIERIRDGRIVERRVTSDWLGMMQQLGLVPPPQGSR